MARKLRIQFPGAIYHVMNRGDHREEIFRHDLDRHCFLETLEEACSKTPRLSMGSRGCLAQLLIDENQTTDANRPVSPVDDLKVVGGTLAFQPR